MLFNGYHKYSRLIEDVHDLTRLINRETNFKQRMFYRKIKKAKVEKLRGNGFRIYAIFKRVEIEE